MEKLLVSDEARREFSNLHHAFDEVNSQLQTKFSQVPSFLSIDLSLSYTFDLQCEFPFLLFIDVRSIRF